MSRKNWSNLFLLLAAFCLISGVVLSNSSRIVAWIAVPCCLTLGTLARRRMN
jgi:hypothetical protein